jgi:hypothetical protein
MKILWRQPFSKLPSLAALRRAVLRAKRAGQGQCTECGARLFPGDGKLCEDCRQISKRTAAAWREANPEAARQQIVTYRTKNRARVNANERAYNAQRKLDGLCLKCNALSLEDSQFCYKHREQERAKARRYQARRRARLAQERLADHSRADGQLLNA